MDHLSTQTAKQKLISMLAGGILRLNFYFPNLNLVLHAYLFKETGHY